MVIGQLGVVVDHILEEFDLFGPDHGQVILVLVDNVDGGVGWEVLVDNDVLKQLIVLAAPDLHH